MPDRVAAVAGALFAVASVAAGVTMPPPPAPDASAATVGSYFSDHQDAVITGSCISATAALALLVFAVGLADRVGQRVVALSGAITATVALVGGLLQGALAQVSDRLTDDSALLSLYVAQRVVFYDAPPIAIAVLLVFAAQGLPRPLGLAGIGIAVLGVVSGLGDIATSSGLPTALGLAGFLLTMGWVIGTSWWLGRSGTATVTARAAQTV